VNEVTFEFAISTVILILQLDIEYSSNEVSFSLWIPTPSYCPSEIEKFDQYFIGTILSETSDLFLCSQVNWKGGLLQSGGEKGNGQKPIRSSQQLFKTSQFFLFLSSRFVIKL
jgi:hypothetical protein